MSNALIRLLIIPFSIQLVGINVLSAQKYSYPYKFNISDPFIMPIGISSVIIGNYLEDHQKRLSPEEILKLDRKDINIFDRTSTYSWSVTADKASNIPKNVLICSPLLLIIPEIICRDQQSNMNVLIKRKFINTINLVSMYFEIYFLTTGLTETTQYIVKRKRPYLYNSSLSENERITLGEDNSAYGSFFSGHTSGSFASAVMLSKMFTDMFGRNKWSYMVWGTSLTLASISGYLRITSGKHYPTDVISGALIGSFVGYSIPALHKNKQISDKISLNIVPNYFGISYSY